MKAITPKVIWLTGLPGSGKTTLALGLTAHLRLHGISVEHLDGDAVREIFPSTGFSDSERIQHIKRMGYFASRLEHHGVTVVASFISPHAVARDFIRGLCRHFIEVHVSTPLEVCEMRDPKGLYARARRKEIQAFSGIDSPYEIPSQPEITVDTSNQLPRQSLDEILKVLERRYKSARLSDHL